MLMLAIAVDSLLAAFLEDEEAFAEFLSRAGEQMSEAQFRKLGDAVIAAGSQEAVLDFTTRLSVQANG